ncbi:hypothetical protein BU26DRAFT_571944 [Trematosphaeria pertusa]|uniref:Uncharacterized protein n=1 Tax=Trematosphaeria pertusa TaxID=390896 RepID=A0A6A6HUP3_9PLEO|nr:uncharacterized protein BU26DRAFT_571944 [Trematosphaeria pertusa]KAF2241478.1 hypothetical protein BU26DRAFT_571944 [Trematosphaeria pertusa]
MPPGEESEPQRRKRKRTLEIARSTDTLQPPVKRQKRSQRGRTPPEFWDNLSRVPLCRRALREFNRRTIRPVALEPPARSVLKEDLVKQLKRFARHGGPNLRDIRGYPAPQTEAVRTMSSSQSRSSRSRIGTGTDPSSAPSQSTRKTTLSSRDPAFEQALIDAGYRPYNRGPKQNNFEEAKERLAQPRPSLSPSQFSDGAFEGFQSKNDEAKTEAVVRSKVFPIIEGNTTIPSGQDEVFNHVQPLASGISNAKPDYYYGSCPTELDPRVRKDLAPYIIPCTDTSRPLLANHFTELKGPDGKASEMKRQITQDLGIGARGMLAIQSYGQAGYTYDGNAYTLGSTYHSGTGTLQLYAMHPTQPEDPSGQPQYHTTQIRSFGMTDTAETFRQGATWYRNSRDLAKEWRDSAIVQANATAVTQASVTANAEYGEASETSPGVAYESQSQETVTSQDGYGEASDPSGAPYGSQSHEETVTTEDEVYFTSQSAQDSETSIDDPAPDMHPRKRNPKSRNSRPRKRNTASSSSQGSIAVESWTFADGRFHCFQGRKKVRSQGDQPRDVWVHNEKGWPNGGEKLWCLWKSDGTADYR